MNFLTEDKAATAVLQQRGYEFIDESSGVVDSRTTYGLADIENLHTKQSRSAKFNAKQGMVGHAAAGAAGSGDQSDSLNDLDQEVASVMKSSTWISDFWQDDPNLNVFENSMIKQKVYDKLLFQYATLRDRERRKREQSNSIGMFHPAINAFRMETSLRAKFMRSINIDFMKNEAMLEAMQEHAHNASLQGNVKKALMSATGSLELASWMHSRPAEENVLGGRQAPVKEPTKSGKITKATAARASTRTSIKKRVHAPSVGKIPAKPETSSKSPKAPKTPSGNSGTSNSQPESQSLPKSSKVTSKGSTGTAMKKHAAVFDKRFSSLDVKVEVPSEIKEDLEKTTKQFDQRRIDQSRGSGIPADVEAEIDVRLSAVKERLADRKESLAKKEHQTAAKRAAAKQRSSGNTAAKSTAPAASQRTGSSNPSKVDPAISHIAGSDTPSKSRPHSSSKNNPAAAPTRKANSKSPPRGQKASTSAAGSSGTPQRKSSTRGSAGGSNSAANTAAKSRPVPPTAPVSVAKKSEGEMSEVSANDYEVRKQPSVSEQVLRKQQEIMEREPMVDPRALRARESTAARGGQVQQVGSTSVQYIDVAGPNGAVLRAAQPPLVPQLADVLSDSLHLTTDLFDAMDPSKRAELTSAGSVGHSVPLAAHDTLMADLHSAAAATGSIQHVDAAEGSSDDKELLQKIIDSAPQDTAVADTGVLPDEPAAPAVTKPQSKQAMSTTGVSGEGAVSLEEMPESQGFIKGKPRVVGDRLEAALKKAQNTLTTLDKQHFSQTSKIVSPVPMHPAVQARFESVWAMLRVPIMEKLDLVMKYSRPELADSAEQAVECWEEAAAVVVERERLLAAVVAAVTTKRQGGAAASISQIRTAFLKASDKCKVKLLDLQSRFDDELTLDGSSYMPQLTVPLEMRIPELEGLDGDLRPATGQSQDQPDSSQ